MGIQRARPSHEILSGDSADVYFARADSILAAEGLDPLVTMEVFTRHEAVLCGIDEAKNLLGHVLAAADPSETHLESLDDGDRIEPREIVLRIRGRYRQFGLYETAFLGMLAHSTGWATAARECVDAAAPHPVISFGARHIHPDITDVLDYAAIIGGCVGASTPAGARLAGLAPTGTMPHSLVLIFGDTVEAALAFDRHLGADVARIVLVDTFKDEAEEALRVAHALGDKLYGIRLDTPSERGRVTADLVHEVRARLDQEGYQHVRIVVSGGLNPDRIGYFKEAAAPVDSYAVGSYISGASPIDFTGDIKEIDGRPIAKRGRIPGITDSPRLKAGGPGGVPGALTAARPVPCHHFRMDDEHGSSGEPGTDDPAPESAYELLQRGQTLLDGRHHAQAAIVLERADRAEPGKASILEALGRAYFNSGQHEAARATFERLLELDPSEHYAHFALGQSLKRLGRRDEAGTHLRLAVALSPGSRLYRDALARLPSGPRRPPGIPTRDPDGPTSGDGPEPNAQA